MGRSRRQRREVGGAAWRASRAAAAAAACEARARRGRQEGPSLVGSWCRQPRGSPTHHPHTHTHVQRTLTQGSSSQTPEGQGRGARQTTVSKRATKESNHPSTTSSGSLRPLVTIASHIPSRPSIILGAPIPDSITCTTSTTAITHRTAPHRAPPPQRIACPLPTLPSTLLVPSKLETQRPRPSVAVSPPLPLPTSSVILTELVEAQRGS